MSEWQLCVYYDGGREIIDFVDGRYTVGASDNDDIRAKELAERSLTWIFVDGVLTLSASALPVFVNGKVVDNFPLDIGSGHVVSVEPYHFAFGETGCEWPEPPELESQEGEQEEPPEVVVPQEVLKPAHIEAKDSLPLGLFAVIMAIVTMGGVFGFSSFYSPDESYDPLKERIDRSYTELSELIATAPGLEGVEIRRRMDGTLILSGFASSESDFATLTEKTVQDGLDTEGYVRNDVISTGSLETILRETFARYPVSYSISQRSSEKVISLVIKGVQQREGQISSILAQLEPQLRVGLAPWQLRTSETYQEEEVFLNAVLDIFEQSRVTESFKAEINAGVLEITGRYAAGAKEVVDAVISEATEYASEFAQVTVNLNSERRLDWTIVALSSGDAPFVLVDSPTGAKRLTVGSRLSGNQRVSEISEDGVSVKLEGYTYFIPAMGFEG